jgi:membrane protein
MPQTTETPAKSRYLRGPLLAQIWAVSKAVWHAIDTRNLGMISAGVAFYGLFAIFPGMAATIAIWGFFADPFVIADMLDKLHDFLPPDAFALVEKQLSTLLATNVSTLGWTTAVTVTVSLVSARAGVAALIAGVSAAHGQYRPSPLSRLLASLLLTLAVIALMLVALATVVAVPAMLSLVSLGPAEGWIITALPWLVIFVVVLIFLGMFYRYGPHRPGMRHNWFTPGGFLAALLWAGASAAFSFYLANFGSYNRVYGSIGAVIALLMWLYISAFIVLLGASVNAELDRNRRASQ